MDKFLTIETIGHITKIENNSKFKVVIGVVPQKPKRKYQDFRIIQPGNFLILDPVNECPLDFTKISIRFEE